MSMQYCRVEYDNHTKFLSQQMATTVTCLTDLTEISQIFQI